jgi:hypothetical protein
VTAQRYARLTGRLRTRLPGDETSAPRLTGCGCERHSDRHDTKVPWPMVMVMSRQLAALSICQLPGLLALYDVDQDDRRRRSQGNRLTASRECHDCCVIPAGRGRRRLPVPQPQGQVIADGGELPPVRAERHRMHRLGMAGEAGLPGPGDRIPQPHRAVLAGGGELPPVRGTGWASRRSLPRSAATGTRCAAGCTGSTRPAWTGWATSLASGAKRRITEAGRSRIIALARPVPSGRLARDAAGELSAGDERGPAQWTSSDSADERICCRWLSLDTVWWQHDTYAKAADEGEVRRYTIMDHYQGVGRPRS